MEEKPRYCWLAAGRGEHPVELSSGEPAPKGEDWSPKHTSLGSRVPGRQVGAG